MSGVNPKIGHMPSAGMGPLVQYQSDIELKVLWQYYCRKAFPHLAGDSREALIAELSIYIA